ncbi:MAG: hypothetical protein Q9227_006305 [Pyrenula ochraceoflavens]
MSTVNGTAATANSQFPSLPATAQKTYNHRGWRIRTQKLPILKAGPIEAMTEKLGIAPPEMIFGDNFVSLEHEGDWGIQFNAYDALDCVDKTGEKRLKVAYSREWHSSREENHEIKEVIKPFDWSYTTDYKGTIAPQSKDFTESDKAIPIDLLRRPDPILFFDDVMLYEDELADNGIAMLSCKIRVMPSRLLLLARFFMRLDNVLLRLHDTRVYVDFDTGDVVREYVGKEGEYEAVRTALPGSREDVLAKMRDPNQLSEYLPVQVRTLEHVKVGN